jgi:hypothetical protein
MIEVRPDALSYTLLVGRDAPPRNDRRLATIAITTQRAIRNVRQDDQTMPAPASPARTK